MLASGGGTHIINSGGVEDPTRSAFQIDYIVPDKTTWSSGDRQLVCLAYQPGAPVDYSIKKK
jgi:hypothetical protein